MPSAARVQWAKFRVALVAVMAVIILCVLLYELFGGVLLAPKTVRYLYIPDASGLTGESPVRVDGIDVGRVSAVELSHSKDLSRAVKVTLQFYRDRLSGIPQDSVVQISSDTLVGDKFVDITSGTSVQSIPAGGDLTYKDQPELVRSLDLTQFTKQLRLVDQMLTDIEQGRSQFGKFYQGTDFYNDLIRRMVEMRKAIEAATSDTSLVGQLLKSGALYNQATGMAESLDQAIAKVQAGQGPGGALLHDSAQYDQLLSEAQAFHHSLDTLGKSDLLQSDSVWVSVNQTLARLIQSVDEFNRNPQVETTTMYENLDGSLKTLQENVRDFRLNPKKYLRLKIF